MPEFVGAETMSLSLLAQHTGNVRSVKLWCPLGPYRRNQASIMKKKVFTVRNTGWNISKKIWDFLTFLNGPAMI